MVLSGQTKTGPSSMSAASRPLRILKSWWRVSMTSTPIASSTYSCGCRTSHCRFCQQVSGFTSNELFPSRVIVWLAELFTFVFWADDEIWTVDEFLERSEEACR